MYPYNKSTTFPKIKEGTENQAATV